MNNMKICKGCHINKNYLDFHKNKNRKDGYQDHCILCLKIMNKKRYENKKTEIVNKSKVYKEKNFNKINDYLIKYRKDNKKYIRELNKLYYQNNKERITKYFKENKLRGNLRTRFRNIVKEYIINNKINIKKLSILNLLNCSIIDYKHYLESQFKPEMNWGNYGKVWEIDHIVPCSKFDLTKLEEQQKCFHYKNTQPLFITTEIAESFGYKNEVGNRNKLNN